MNNYIEMSGKTILEAVEKAKEMLGLDYDELEHEVLEEAKKGFLGFGARDAKVLVWKKGFDVKKAMADEKKKAENAVERTEKTAKFIEEPKLKEKSDVRTAPAADTKKETKKEIKETKKEVKKAEKSE